MLQEQIAKYDLLVDQFETAKREHDECVQMLSANRANAKILRKFMADLLEQHELVTEFDNQLWASLVLHVTVYSKDDIRVTFKDGTEIKA